MSFLRNGRNYIVNFIQIDFLTHRVKQADLWHDGKRLPADTHNTRRVTSALPAFYKVVRSLLEAKEETKGLHWRIHVFPQWSSNWNQNFLYNMALRKRSDCMYYTIQRFLVFLSLIHRQFVRQIDVQVRLVIYCQ